MNARLLLLTVAFLATGTVAAEASTDASVGQPTFWQSYGTPLTIALGTLAVSAGFYAIRQATTPRRIGAEDAEQP